VVWANLKKNVGAQSKDLFLCESNKGIAMVKNGRFVIYQNF
jgi:hypothetical protein